MAAAPVAHPNLAIFGLAEASEAAMMWGLSANLYRCFDYRTGPGYSRSITVGADGEPVAANGREFRAHARWVTMRDPRLTVQR